VLYYKVLLSFFFQIFARRPKTWKRELEKYRLAERSDRMPSYLPNPAQGGGVREQPPTILIIDDTLDGQMALKTLLAGQGYTLAFANNGADGLAQATALIPDLILLDVMMPDIDGMEVCRRVRANPLLAEVPIIMITALDDRGTRLRGIEAGADDFIPKRFDGTLFPSALTGPSCALGCVRSPV
jgi:CheY-like chemotaxis protein